MEPDYDPSNCDEAADYLINAFDWTSSPEGYEFWVKIYENLRTKARDHRR